jgi:hypothetical protein
VALITSKMLDHLSDIVTLTESMCGDNFEHIGCSCLEDGNDEHDLLCPADVVGASWTTWQWLRN